MCVRPQKFRQSSGLTIALYYSSNVSIRHTTESIHTKICYWSQIYLATDYDVQKYRHVSIRTSLGECSISIQINALFLPHGCLLRNKIISPFFLSCQSCTGILPGRQPCFPPASLTLFNLEIDIYSRYSCFIWNLELFHELYINM